MEKNPALTASNTQETLKPVLNAGPNFEPREISETISQIDKFDIRESRTENVIPDPMPAQPYVDCWSLACQGSPETISQVEEPNVGVPANLEPPITTEIPEEIWKDMNDPVKVDSCPDTDFEEEKENEQDIYEKFSVLVQALADILDRVEKLELRVDGVLDRIALHNVKSSHKI